MRKEVRDGYRARRRGSGASPGVPCRAGTRAETASLRASQRAEFHATPLTDDDGAQPLLAPTRRARLPHRLQAGRREDFSGRQTCGCGLRWIPLVQEDTVAGESLPRVVRQHPSGGLCNQPATAQAVGSAVLRRRHTVRLVGMQPQVTEAAAALMAQQTFDVLVEDPVVAVAVLIADLHDVMVSNSSLKVTLRVGVSDQRRGFVSPRTKAPGEHWASIKSDLGRHVSAACQGSSRSARSIERDRLGRTCLGSTGSNRSRN